MPTEIRRMTAPDSPEPAAAAPETGDTLDDLILKQAMIAGALELLPEKLSTAAIIPVQIRLVYQIGQRHGQKLDADQVKDLAAAFGIGATAQVLEGVVRKTLGGLAGGILGGLAGGATGVAAGAAVTFSATYALGHVAKQYYAQGRKLSAEDLRALFERFREEAKGLYPKVQSQIEAQAKTLDVKSLLNPKS
jgi:uncharacterized protein (DUF697 family)